MTTSVVRGDTLDSPKSVLTGGPLDSSPEQAKRPASRRGTTNRNVRGGSDDRRRRREWLVSCYRSDTEVIVIELFHGPLLVPVLAGTPGALPTCRCYRCGTLLTTETVTADRIKPGCRGGTYARSNIRPCCGPCNSETGGSTRGKARS